MYVADPGEGGMEGEPLSSVPMSWSLASLFSRAAAMLLMLAVSAGCASASQSPAPAQSAPPASPEQGYPGWPGSGGTVGGSELVPVVISSDLAVGPNRFLFYLLDRENALVAAPEIEAHLRFFDLAADPTTPTEETDGRFFWTIEDELGSYAASVEFGRAGDWGVEITVSRPDEPETTARVLFPVRAESAAPAIGEEVPASETPTASSPDEIARISTEDSPDPDFYRLSVAEALEGGRPFLVAFATPAFCTSRTCGPALDIIKRVAPDYKAQVDFIHVEPYRLQEVDGQLQPLLDANGAPQIEPFLGPDGWNLPTEPFIAVVNADGTLSSKFEGVVGEEELREALDQVAAG